jgi:hypothetical protein
VCLLTGVLFAATAVKAFIFGRNVVVDLSLFVNRRSHVSPHYSLFQHKMVRMSVLADCLKTITNAEKRGKRQVLIRPSSKVVIKFLQCMQVHGELD